MAGKTVEINLIYDSISKNNRIETKQRAAATNAIPLTNHNADHVRWVSTPSYFHAIIIIIIHCAPTTFHQYFSRTNYVKNLTTKGCGATDEEKR